MTRGGHVPVLADDVLELLRPERAKLIVDCTVGLGGHSCMLLDRAPSDARLIGIDVDETNLRQARENLAEFGERVRLFQANFSQLTTVLDEADESSVDAILADLGVASTQLDDAERGLSFQADGPLDMRLDPRLDETAEGLINRLSERELADLIYEYGQERYSRRVARAIVQQRKKGRIATTGQLADIVSRSLPRPARSTRRGVHPATRTFQALRIAVNDEMSVLETLLDSLPNALAPGGRAAVISFHSLEDRPVKHTFNRLAADGTVEVLTKKPITPGPDEMARNPRSRSAKLRAIERINTG
ncbi:MAG: 16S rRNA (cytosine(1402)-N(4))-methyltransferase RsmH [Planctomycetota bacterium]